MRDTLGWASGKTILAHLGFLVAYMVLFHLSNIFPTTDLRSTPWNPEAGIAVAAGAFLGWSAVPMIAVANFLGHQLEGSAFAIGWDAIAAVMHALIFAGTGALRHDTIRALNNATVAAVLRFLGLAFVITALSAIVRLAIAMAAMHLSPAYLLTYIVALSVGNLIGITTIVPMFFAIQTPAEVGRYLSRWPVFLGFWLGAILVISFIVFGLKRIDEFKFFYLVFIPVIALAVKGGFVAAVPSIVISDISMIAIMFWRDFEPSTATELQVLMISLSITGLILGAAISERQGVSRLLEESYARLQESQASLLHATRISLASEMAAALAHELNQPLSSIRNFVRSVRRNLDKGNVDEERIKSDIDAAVKQVDAAANLIKKTRHFLEKGEVSFVDVDLGQLLDVCIELVDPELKKSQISISVSLPPSLSKVSANPLQLQQVILNLVRNAKESIVEGNAMLREIIIEVRAHSRPGHIEVSVSDSGPGISEEIRPMLFKPLKSSKKDGLGLGLSLCSTIILAHGGDLWCDQGRRSGARFVFTIPITPSKPDEWQSLTS